LSRQIAGKVRRVEEMLKFLSATEKRAHYLRRPQEKRFLRQKSVAHQLTFQFPAADFCRRKRLMNAL
jgi:hypothetical protein